MTVSIVILFHRNAKVAPKDFSASVTMEGIIPQINQHFLQASLIKKPEFFTRSLFSIVVAFSVSVTRFYLNLFIALIL